MAWIHHVDQGRHPPTAAGTCRRRGGSGCRGVRGMDAAAKLTGVRALCLRSTASQAPERTAASGWAGPRRGTCSVPCNRTHPAIPRLARCCRCRCLCGCRAQPGQAPPASMSEYGEYYRPQAPRLAPWIPHSPSTLPPAIAPAWPVMRASTAYSSPPCAAPASTAGRCARRRHRSHATSPISPRQRPLRPPAIAPACAVAPSWPRWHNRRWPDRPCSGPWR